MTYEPNLFDEMNANTTTSEIEELLNDPFTLDTTSQKNVSSELYDATILSQRTVTSEKLIDRLPEHRQQQARELAKQIDETNMSAIITYGSNAQKKLSEFSRSILQNLQTKDTGEIGDVLTELMHQLESTNPRELTTSPSVLQKLFGKVRTSIMETQAKYQKLSSHIDRIAIRLDREKNELLNDNLVLEQIYQKNKDYFEALNIYIAAGELKMHELQSEIIPKAIETAQQSTSQMDIQTVHDLNQFLDRLDKRTHDLRLTRQMTIQQAPQIRMIQNTNEALAEKIQVSIHTAIPLWENQIAIALTLLRQQQAVNSQRQVTQTTNDLLRKNAAMLKQAAIDTAHEAERGVVDLETLQHTQQNLIETIEQTMEIQQEGRRQRQIAEHELNTMEQQLRDKLLAISNEQQQYVESQYSS